MDNAETDEILELDDTPKVFLEGWTGEVGSGTRDAPIMTGLETKKAPLARPLLRASSR